MGGLNKTDQFLKNYEIIKKCGKNIYFSFFTNKKPHLLLESPFFKVRTT